MLPKKSRPIHTRVSDTVYDSRFEASIAQSLRPLAYTGNVSISTQCKLLIKPATSRHGSRFWKCDFKLTYKGEDLYIEAKGFNDDLFRIKMELLDLFSPDAYQSLLIVVPIGFNYPNNWNVFNEKICDLALLQVRIKEWISEVNTKKETVNQTAGKPT
jgi:hypothetical protein